MNNFTPRAQQALALSRKEAERFNHNYVGTEHLLLGIVRLGQGTAVTVLMKLGLDLVALRNEIEKQVGSGPDAKMSGNIPYTPRVKTVLGLAGREANQLHHTYVGTEHILLGLLREGDGVAARVLRSLNVDIERTRIMIVEELSPPDGSPHENRIPGGLPQPEPYDLKSVPDRASSSRIGQAPDERPHPAIRPYLNHDEVLIWSGAPRKKFRFERKHLPMLLFMAPVFAFVMFFLIMFIIAPTAPNSPATGTAQAQQTSPTQTSAESEPQKPPPPLAVRIFMATFAFCFIGAIMAQILYRGGFTLGGNAFLQGETLYGVTNQRVIIIAGKKSKTVRFIHLGSVTDLRMKQWPDGLGTISAGPESPWPYPSPTRGTNPLLENIAEPAKVFKIMIDVRKLA